MRRQAIVIGLGQFGMALAQSLAQKGVEVLAVDRREDLVRSASTFTAEAVAFDATDERSLARTSPERRDMCIVAIGDESREGSIICTALLRQMGAKHVVGRATDPLHERILRLVGAHDVVNPERAFGERFAARLLYSAVGVIDEIPLGKDLTITELRIPKSFVGRSLIDLQLPRRYGITVIALRRENIEDVVVPEPREPLMESDILVVVAKRDAIAQLSERV
jgi:trk system potassium uptake protein TrkA